MAGCTSSNIQSPTQEQQSSLPAGDTTSTPPPTTPTTGRSMEETSTLTTGEFDGLIPNAETSLIFQALNNAGIADAAVEYQTETVLVAFDLPSSMTNEGAAYFALGVASKFAQPTQILWVQVFEGSTSKTYFVKADTVQKYTTGKLNENQLKLAVTVQ